MNFTNAYILGIQRRSDYFGERTANYRTVDTISVEGYIDVRASNTDLKGVRQAIQQIDNYVAAASSSSSIMEAITINETGFGTGRIVSLDFPASSATDEDQIRIGKYTAEIEVYNSGDIRSTFESQTRSLTLVSADDSTDVFTKSNHNLLDGVEVEITAMTGTGPSLNTRYYVDVTSENNFQLYEDPSRTSLVDVTSDPFIANFLVYYTVPFPQFLDNISEDFSYSLSEDNTYELNHSLSITYISGIEAGGSAIDPISTSKTLAGILFDQTPTQFSTVIDNSYGSISVASRKYTNETYNLIDGSCDFDRRLVLLPSGESTYSLRVSNSFSFDEGGIVTVSENGEIEPRSADFLTEAISALDTEIGNSYDRCNTVYTSYKNYLGTNAGSLNNRAVSTSKNVNNSSAKSSYSVQYTDDKSFKNLTFLEERTTQLSESDNIVTVNENGTITSVNFKDTEFDSLSLIPSRSDVKTRCQSFYTLNDKTNTLKNLSNKFTVPKYGKQLSYEYSFTDDPDVFDNGTFARRKVTIDDKIGTPNQAAFIVPNVTDQILHTPEQTSLGTRSVKMEGQLRRAQFTNNLNERPNPTSAINTSKSDMLQQAYSVYANNNQIQKVGTDTMYITNASYSFSSDDTFSMSIDAAFSMQRFATVNQNLVFNP